jgi:cell division protein FtsX
VLQVLGGQVLLLLVLRVLRVLVTLFVLVVLGVLAVAAAVEPQVFRHLVLVELAEQAHSFCIGRILCTQII